MSLCLDHFTLLEIRVPNVSFDYMKTDYPPLGLLKAPTQDQIKEFERK